MIAEIIKIALGLWICYGVYKFILYPYLYKKYAKEVEKREKFVNSIRHDMQKSIDENRKMRSNEMPSDEDILLYYKMYCKKWELDNKNTWTTLQPISFDEWERDVKEDSPLGYNGWRYMIYNTSDAFMSGADGHSLIRYNDYEKMVKDEDQQFMNDVEQAAEEMENI